MIQPICLALFAAAALSTVVGAFWMAADRKDSVRARSVLMLLVYAWMGTAICLASALTRTDTPAATAPSPDRAPPYRPSPHP